MAFALSEELALLQNSLRRFLADRASSAVHRRPLAMQAGFDPQFWREMAQTLGLMAAPFDMTSDENSAAGGVAGQLIMEAFGEALVLEPYLEAVIVAGQLLSGRDGGHQEATLKGLKSGAKIVIPALYEFAGRYNLAHVETEARVEGGGWRLSGAKALVTGAAAANTFIVSARVGAGKAEPMGIGLFEVPADAPGLSQSVYRTVDGRSVSDLRLQNVKVEAGGCIGVAGEVYSSIEAAADAGAAGLAAESLGLMRVVLRDTIAYTRQRRQFGQPLAEFQSLQHTMVDMYMALEKSVSAVHRATLSLPEAAMERGLAVSAARVVTGAAGRRIGQAAIQLHGGMGMTEELPLGQYFKRLTANEKQWGDADFHLARYAQLKRANFPNEPS